mmetsp:Transcript_46528/g.56337  ORF Transcript_46528/g.56337 Transcript_46528/m.56337 type:complete len:146 (+) Transcript_46528:439-876(+)|eukprot:CAMPEP_0172519842 /NCGR_PEP_ID=MMETSP1066-20121228/291655_1 /TAXON_ID=671091 /ORGANISM="Coscinodiscus wailesii, Strain CCMP2513" /LENGTH=145 /DNA_ID=CAMNT_0013302505 /DNA_START=407 /DNA_END=844 /DNA_ORIENTATION=+
MLSFFLSLFIYSIKSSPDNVFNAGIVALGDDYDTDVPAVAYMDIVKRFAQLPPGTSWIETPISKSLFDEIDKLNKHALSISESAFDKIDEMAEREWSLLDDRMTLYIRDNQFYQDKMAKCNGQSTQSHHNVILQYQTTAKRHYNL